MSFEYHAKCRHHFLWRKADIVMETSMTANDPAGRHHSPKFLLYGGCIDFAKPKPRTSRDNSGDRNFYGKTRD